MCTVNQQLCPAFIEKFYLFRYVRNGVARECFATIFQDDIIIKQHLVFTSVLERRLEATLHNSTIKLFSISALCFENKGTAWIKS